eukprot:TRINITY_DN16695_c0_g1_i1.p1 TRINITY_DN16695_c0_g1~~TRINITY_DN16695_c0_g1_i1.p1  ORF type:complete len:1212 (-),score=327.62 TRINITY_DN16695_c0_g1_i1:36-3392(-)
MMYCEMLGQPVEFGYILILKLTQMRARLIDKRVAYVCGGLFLRPTDSMITLWVNSFIRDLKSTNQLENEMALQCMTNLLNDEAIPAVLDLVVEKLKHENASIRKKAVMVLKKIVSIDKSFISQVGPHLQDALCDHNPSVMAASLNAYEHLIDDSPRDYKSLIPSLVSIQQQVMERCLSRDFDYNGIPSPWIQIKIIRLLSKLGKDDKESSQMIYEIISETLRRSDIGIPAGHAIVYECAAAITHIYPNGTLLDVAAESITKFIGSNDNNLKYLGLKALNDIIKINPKYALQHQVAVIECLNDPDETIQRMTLELLYTMTNPANVTVVAEKLLENLCTQTDKFLREDLVNKITSLADRFSPDNEWFIRTMNKVFLWGGNLVKPGVAYNLLILLAEGSTGGEDEQADNELRAYAVESYFEIVEKYPVLTSILIQVISWTLGEYAFLVNKQTMAFDLICDLMDRPQDDEHVRVWIVNALTKLVAQTQTYPIQIQEIVAHGEKSSNVELQQRCCELKTLVSSIALMNTLLPLDASCWDLAVDSNLSFLDPWVHQQVISGLVPAVPYRNRNAETEKMINRGRKTSRAGGKNKLRYAYDPPTSLSQIDRPVSSIFDSLASVSESAAAVYASPAAFTSAGGPWGTGGWGAVRARASSAAPVAPTSFGVSAINHEISHESTPVVGSGSYGTAAPDDGVDELTSAFASGLFSGVGSKSPTGSRAPQRKPAKALEPLPTPSIYSTPASAGAGSNMFSGLGVESQQESIFGSAAVVPTTAASPSIFGNVQTQAPAQPKSGSINLFDLDFNASAPVSTDSSAFGLLDPSLFGSLPGMSPAPAPVSAPVSQSSSSSGFSFIGASSASNYTQFASQLQRSSDFSLENLQKNSVITEKIIGRRMTAQQLVHNQQLVVSWCKVFNSSGPSVALFTSNNSSGDITNVQMSFAAPQSLQLQLISDSVHTVVDQSVRIQSIPAGLTAVFLIPVVPTSPGSNTSFNVTLSYSSNNSPAYGKFDCTLSAFDFLVPHNITIQQYASEWPQHPREKAQQIPNQTISTPEIFRDLVSQTNFQVIQIQGQELVCAAQYLSDSPKLCLLFAKIQPHTLSIQLRTKDSMLTEYLSTQLKNLFNMK